jgi:hypothetical protein
LRLGGRHIRIRESPITGQFAQAPRYVKHVGVSFRIVIRRSRRIGICFDENFLSFVIFGASFENTAAWMIHRMNNPKYAELTQHSVIPAKAGIQASGGGEQTWIPACAGMTSRGGNVLRDTPPFSCSAGERKLMNHFVVKTEFQSGVVPSLTHDLRPKARRVRPAHRFARWCAKHTLRDQGFAQTE